MFIRWQREGKSVMRQRQRWFLLLIFLLVVPAACRTSGSDGIDSSAARLHSRPVRVLVLLKPRPGLAIPEATKLEIVVRRNDYPEHIVAVQPLANVRRWPASFAVPVKWPNVPDEGEDVDWKGSPPDLSVFARGILAGRETFISQAQRYTVADSAGGRALRLVLIPVME